MKKGLALCVATVIAVTTVNAPAAQARPTRSTDQHCLVLYHKRHCIELRPHGNLQPYPGPIPHDPYIW
jgi:hypothetical protein